MRQFIFIGGTGRCGTTAMRHAFRQQENACVLHRELRVHVEGGGLIDLLQGGRKHVGNVFKDKVSRVTYRHPKKKRIEFFESRVMPHTAWVVSATPPSPTAISKRKRIAREYMERIFRPQPGQVIVEDSPPNMRRAEGLKELFPSARFIHMVRHPLQVLTSTMKRSWGEGKSAAANAETIAYHLECSLRQERAMGACAIRVRLEDISLSSGATKERLADFLPEFDVDLIVGHFDHAKITKHEVDDDVRRAYHRYLHRFAVDMGY